jgi:hypothetical protein
MLLSVGPLLGCAADAKHVITVEVRGCMLAGEYDWCDGASVISDRSVGVKCVGDLFLRKIHCGNELLVAFLTCPR